MHRGQNLGGNQNLIGKMSLLVGVALLGILPGQASAHRSWLKPSAAQVEGTAPWVTVDAATSEGIFDFDSFALKLDGLTVVGPDGQPVAVDGAATGHLRSTFDVQLNKPGTYRIGLSNATVMASYKQNGEIKRIRGTEDDLKTVPADATDLKVSRMGSRVETFVTAGKPNDTALQPTGKGLELVPVTHPSDMFQGEPAKLKFLLDGKPLADLSVLVIPGGVRFRNAMKEASFKTDADGVATVEWPMAGEYLVTVSYPPRVPGQGGQGGGGGGGGGGQGRGEGGGPAGAMGAGAPGQVAGGPEGAGRQGGGGQGGGGQGGGRGAGGPGGPATEVVPGSRYTYTATFEVLPN